mgnify:CR=1 FL=1
MKTKLKINVTYEKALAVLLTGVLFFTSFLGVFFTKNVSATESTTDLEAMYIINLSDFTITVDGETNDITTYTLENYETFLNDYENGTLPQIYITEFIFDGVSTVYKMSLSDDLTSIEDYDLIECNVINVNTVGNIEFTGTATKTTIAVNSNDKEGDINIILNNVTLTSKNTIPALFVYNKDITYDLCNVTIYSKEGSINTLTGGRLKKVSLMDKDNLSDYASVSTNYINANLDEYYGVYSADEIENILFACETADNEDIADGDPLYFYKYSGAVSSDIDLTFTGSGTLNINSTKKEGVETKGNINFVGGVGDYYITSYDDGLNASTTGTDISINVNTLVCDCLTEYVTDSDDVSVASSDSEGDAIDSNGTIHIYGGIIIARACEGSQDSGVDSDNGIYINGGILCSTGNMLDTISTDSLQTFMTLTFQSKVAVDTTIVITDTDGNVIMAYTTDREFTSIVLSSDKLAYDTTYYVYKDGDISGEIFEGYYTSVTSYTAGTMQQYTGTESYMGGISIPGTDTGFIREGEAPEMPGITSNNELDFNMQELSQDSQSSNNLQDQVDNQSNGQDNMLVMPDNNTMQQMDNHAAKGFNQEDIINSQVAGSTEFTLTTTTYSFTGVSDAILTKETEIIDTDSSNEEVAADKSSVLPESDSVILDSVESDSLIEEVAADITSTGDSNNALFYFLILGIAILMFIGIAILDRGFKRIDR